MVAIYGGDLWWRSMVAIYGGDLNQRDDKDSKDVVWVFLDTSRRMESYMDGEGKNTVFSTLFFLS